MHCLNLRGEGHERAEEGVGPGVIGVQFASDLVAQVGKGRAA